MIKHLFYLLVLAFWFPAYSMNNFDTMFEHQLIVIDSLPPNKALNLEQLPYFQGCEEVKDLEKRKSCSDKNIIDFIRQHITYPELARAQNIQGVAVIQFYVNKDGQIIDPTIIKNPGAGTGEEALRIIKSMPKWNPGVVEGKPIKARFTLPIKFNLEDEFFNTKIKWSSLNVTGNTEIGNTGAMTVAEIPIDDLNSLFSKKEKGLFLQLKLKEETVEYHNYFISVNKKGKKLDILSVTKNNGTKKKLLKDMKVGDELIFYENLYRKVFLKIKII